MRYLRPVREMSLVTRFFDLPRVSQQTTVRLDEPGPRQILSLKIGIVIEEADEAVLWLELLADGNVLPAAKLEGLLTEAKTTAGHFFSLRAHGQEMTTDHNCDRMPALIGSLASRSRAITRSPDHPILP